MIEYRVKPVTRFVITRFHQDDETNIGGVETMGAFENEDQAVRIAAGLTASEADKGAIFCRDLGDAVG